MTVEFTNHKSLSAVTVANFVPADRLPAALAHAAESTLKDVLQSGEFGYPMMNAQAKILEATIDPQLSTDDAFAFAAARAYREATADNLLVLEPIMRVRVTTPSEFLGNVIGDIGARGGEIDRSEMLAGDLAEVEARVPLRKLFDYEDRVRSLSQGRAASAMEPFSYEPAPDDVIRQLMGG
jgi:elongation factor G